MSSSPDRRLRLDSVTLVAVTSVASAATLRAIQACKGQAQFADVLLLSDQPPPSGGVRLQWRQIERICSRYDYSRFMLRELADHIQTSHVLCIQWDGFILDGGAWDPAFLDYDYIGAVWPHFRDNHNVGNGGFSLRSLRLLRACQKLPFDESQFEDLVICRQYRPQLEAEGIRFAPAEIARRFAFEREAPTGKEFGFHGSYNLVRYLLPSDALRLFRSLDPHMLSRGERLELFRWALKHGYVRLALTMLNRLIGSKRGYLGRISGAAAGPNLGA